MGQISVSLSLFLSPPLSSSDSLFMSRFSDLVARFDLRVCDMGCGAMIIAPIDCIDGFVLNKSIDSVNR